MKNINDTVSIKAAAAAINSGDRIWVSGNHDNMKAFLAELEKRAGELKDVTLITDDMNVGREIGSIKYHGSFKVIGGIAEAIVKTYKDGDRLEFLTAPAKKVVDILCRDFGVNTLVAEMLPADEEGLCTLGHFGRAQTAAIFANDRITKRIAIIDAGVKETFEGAAKVALPADGFDIVTEDGCRKVA